MLGFGAGMLWPDALPEVDGIHGQKRRNYQR